MNKELLSLALLFTVLFLPMANAAPTSTVVFPNGGEVLTGTETFSWIATSPEFSQDLNVKVNFSLISGSQDPNNLILDDNLLDHCGLPDSFNFWSRDTNFEGGLDTIMFGHGNSNQSKPALYVDDSGLLNIIFKSFEGGSVDYTGATWNSGTTNWDSNSSIINSAMESLGGEVHGSFDYFEYNNEKWLIQKDFVASGSYGTLTYNLNDNNWSLNTALSSGLVTNKPFGAKTSIFIPSSPILGKSLWLVNYLGDSYYWESDSWYATDNNYFGIIKNLIPESGSLITDSIDIKSFNNELYLFYPTRTAGNRNVFKWNPASETWVTSNDLNTFEDFSLTYHFQNFEYLGEQYILTTDMEDGGTDDARIYKFGPNIYNTSQTLNCSFSYDTSLIPNANYYLDVNVIDNENSTTVLDSSDNKFTIANWDEGDINCSCIANCSSCTIDANGFNVVPTNESADVEIKLTNNVDPKNFKTNIQNSDNSGNQYKVHIASQSDFTAGIWNYANDLTFGTTNYDSLQKVWDPVNLYYKHSFTDTILSLEVIYYRFEYYQPAYHYFTVNQIPWDNELTPDTTDFNTIQSDIFSISYYSNIGSVLTTPKFPSITDNVDESTNYVFQFTMKSDSVATGEVRAGTIPELLSPSAPSDAINLSTAYKTITVDDISDGFIKFDSIATTSRTLHFQNYSISERGFFTKPVEIVRTSGAVLPVYLEGGTVYRYVSEGEPFRVKSEFFDPDGLIDQIEISAYVDLVADANRLKKWIFDSSGTGLINIDETIEGLVDLTASAPNRDVKITIRLIDTNAQYYEIQSDHIRLVQFPYFPGDFSINTFIFNKQVGKHPKGEIIIKTDSPNTLRGVRYYLYQRSGAQDRSDYNTTFYKGQDFNCNGLDCSFEYEIEDWLFPEEEHYSLTVSALLTTENEDYNSSITAKTIYFRVYWKEFETARILETFERNADHTYRDDEEISVTLQLRESDYANLKENVEVWLTLANCDADGGVSDANCAQQDLNYRPDQFLYDVETGYNYYFWKQVFINENGSVLDDGNYYRFMATVSDPQGTHGSTTAIYPLLTEKCQDYDTDCTDDGNLGATTVCFLSNMFGFLNHFTSLSGCTRPSSVIVTTETNDTNENRILIDATKSLSAPTHECHFCYNADTNNVYRDQLKQDLVCGSWYTFNEAPIDSFRFYLTNKNSDLSKEGEDAQYISFEIPYSQIAFNDLTVMRKGLEMEFGTKADTIGELIWQWGNKLFVDFANPLIEVPEGLSASGLITDFGIDCNFSRPFDPTYIDGMVFYKLKGIDLINQQDFISSHSDLENVDSTDLIEFMNYEGITVPVSETQLEVFVSDGIRIKNETISSPLVINEPYSDASIRRENIEDETSNYETLPTSLKFNSIADLVYNGERNVIRRFASFTITATISQKETVISTIFSFIGSNIIILFLAIMAIAILVIIYRKAKGNNPNQIIISDRGG